jgi:hypothetical protein
MYTAKNLWPQNYSSGVEKMEISNSRLPSNGGITITHGVEEMLNVLTSVNN